MCGERLWVWVRNEGGRGLEKRRRGGGEARRREGEVQVGWGILCARKDYLPPSLRVRRASAAEIVRSLGYIYPATM